MKKTVFFGLLVILLVFGFLGCDTNGNNNGNDNPFLGTWIQDGSGGAVKVVVNDSAWVASDNNITYNSGTYNYTGTTGIFTVTYKGNGSAEVGSTGSVEIQSGKMVFTAFTDPNMNGTYSK